MRRHLRLQPMKHNQSYTTVDNGYTQTVNYISDYNADSRLYIFFCVVNV